MNRRNDAFTEKLRTALRQPAHPDPSANKLFSHSDGELDAFRDMFLDLFDENPYDLPFHQADVRSQLERALAENPADLASLKGMHDTGGGPALTEVRGSILHFDDCIGKLPNSRRGFSYFDGLQYARFLGPNVRMMYPERYLRLGNELKVPLDRGRPEVFLNTSMTPEQLATGRVFTGNGNHYYLDGVYHRGAEPRYNTENPNRVGEGEPVNFWICRGLRFSLTMDIAHSKGLIFL